MRGFVAVGDCVAVRLGLLDNRRVSGLFNMGSGEARGFAELIGALFAAFGREPRIEYVDTPEAIRANYQYFTRAEMGRLRAAGYEAPFRSLEEGVAAYVRDFLASDDPADPTDAPREPRPPARPERWRTAHSQATARPGYRLRAGPRRTASWRKAGPPACAGKPPRPPVRA